MKKTVNTHYAPAAIGCYSQAVQSGHLLYLAGQIPLDPETMTLVQGGIELQVTRVFDNIKAVAEAAGATMDAIVKLTVYLLDIADISIVNHIMAQYFSAPYPARTSIAVAALPKEARVEIEAIIDLTLCEVE